MRFNLFSSRKDCYIGFAKSSLCACERAGLHRLHILKGRTVENGILEFTVFGKEKEIKDVAKKFKTMGIPVDICEKADVKMKDTLTRKQMMILKTALQLGFFDYPKRVNLKELSDIFGIPPPP